MEFVISDTHFGHKRIIELQNRPFRDVDEMDAALVGKWNSTVGPSDIVYHLGDFAFGGKERVAEYRRALNGRIVIVRGNHDYDTKQLIDLGFDAACDFYGSLWGVCGVVMCHRPLDIQLAKARFRCQKFPIVLYGHIHTNGLKASEDGNIEDGRPAGCVASANMGVELWNYAPQPLQKVLEYIWTRHSHVVGPEDTKEYFSC